MSTMTSVDRFAAGFADGFTRSAFRFELRDVYEMRNEAEPYARFLAGEADDQAWRDPWRRTVRGAVAAGRTMARVHVVSEPWTDYVRFALTRGYPANVFAGEDVRILPRRAAHALDLPDHDFWLLDSARVALLSYDRAGVWTGVDVVDDAEVVTEHLRWQAIAMRASEPLNDYVRSRG